MSATSVGQIGLDLVVNQKQFHNQMSGIQQLAKKTGKMLASAFAVKKLIDFGKECLELGSDLQEVQNVVDVTFPNMTAKVDDFAKSASASFGLSEAMAKKFTGTYGAMAKAFGFTEKAAFEMGSTLTGLAGDVASFYNISQDEAYTKLKSVFSGETETLKDLGIVMTQNALDAYALANGYGKTTKSMSEAEKVALRYAFVQKQLSSASGDFARTSDSWANQTRILKLQFDSLKASIGQGLINLFTPAIKIINSLIGKLSVLASKFKSFTELLTGKKSSDTQLSEAASGADSLTESVAGIGNAAKKSIKEMKALAGFDELNNLSSSSDSGSGSSAGGTGTNAGIPSAGETGSKVAETEGSLDNIKRKLDELASWSGLDKLWERTQQGIDKINFNAIKTNCESIFSSLEPIAKTSLDGVGTVARSFCDTVGTIFGNLISIAGKSVEITTGGVSIFLENEKGKITSWISTTANTIARGFDNLSFASENIFGSLWTALDDNQGKIETSISNMLTSFSVMNMTIGTIFSDIWEGITKGFADFTVTHKSDISKFFDGIIGTSTKFSDTISKVIGDVFKSLSNFWEKDGKRIWNEVVGVFYDIVGWVMKIYNEVIAPIVDAVAEELGKLWKDHLQPLWDNVLDLLSSVWDAIKMCWDQRIKPIVDWIIEYVGPVISAVFQGLVKTIGTCFGVIADVVSGIIKSLKGIIDFTTGVFTGNWKKAWNGVKSFFSGIWTAIWGIVKGVINQIINGLNLLWTGLYSALRIIVNGIGKAVEKIGDIVGKDWGFSIPAKAPQIPRLAQGGYVKANTPQLAIIGDNRHHGEIVSPEDKLEQMALTAAKLVGGSNQESNELLRKEISLLQRMIELLTAILEKETGISAESIFESVRQSADSYNRRTGKQPFLY